MNYFVLQFQYKLALILKNTIFTFSKKQNSFRYNHCRTGKELASKASFSTKIIKALLGKTILLVFLNSNFKI
ncbi:MAG TPA: hypothetical protein DCR46_07165 [Cytophagales bacterium]|nr:hypothetical protein [Cytophagales bacterium]